MEDIEQQEQQKKVTHRLTLVLDDSPYKDIKKISDDSGLPIATVTKLLAARALDLYKKGEIKLV